MDTLEVSIAASATPSACSRSMTFLVVCEFASMETPGSVASLSTVRVKTASSGALMTVALPITVMVSGAPTATEARAVTCVGR